MIDYKYYNLFADDSIDKQVKIEYDGGTITNDELIESMELTESLCSESELRFGCCEASVLKFRVANIFQSLVGKRLTVSETLAGNTDVPFQIGRYKVFSDKPTADRRYRDVVAYDAMYDIISANVADWYNSLLPEKTSTVTLKQFRTSFIAYFGLEQGEIELINDDMVVEKTIEPSEISGKDVITAICEINGCFGHIGRNGKFWYILLPKYIEGLYPADDLYPANNLYPADPKSARIGKSTYISCKYEDFVTHKIDKLQIRQEENDIGAIVGTGNNCYIVEDNFLVYGKSAADLEQIAKKLLSVVSDVVYRPFEADAKGNPCFEVGDAVRMPTRYEIVESYILNRTLKGIQALRDKYSADGVEEYSEKVNSVNRSIIQLKGKTNTLERTVEETKSEIKDVEKGLQTKITQNTKSIAAEAKRASAAEGELTGKLEVTAESIAAEVKRAQGQEVELAAAINVNAENILLKVSKNNIVSEINQSAEGIKIAADKIELVGVTTVNGNTTVKEDGSLEVKNANVEMTAGNIKIETAEAGENVIILKHGEVKCEMGTFGVRSTADTRTATFMMSNITVENETSAGTLIAQLLDNGKGVSSYGWDSYSDKRLKHDIKPLDIYERARFIYAQEPVRYKYNYDPDGHYRHGLIAQRAQETIGVEDWALCGENVGADGETYLTLNYLELIADLIATVQSQNERIKVLEEKLYE